MNRKLVWRVTYAVGWCLHWPVLALGALGMGVTCASGWMATGITKALRLAHVYAFGGGK